MKLAKISSKGQVTLPKRIREILGTARGDYLLFEIDEKDRVVVRAVKQKPLSALYGSLPATRPYPGKEETRREVGEKLATRRSR